MSEGVRYARAGPQTAVGITPRPLGPSPAELPPGGTTPAATPGRTGPGSHGGHGAAEEAGALCQAVHRRGGKTLPDSVPGTAALPG